MKNNITDYEIIIVGGNHHNGLGLARIFGLNGMKVNSIVIDEHSKKSFLRLSKFVNNSRCFKTEKDAFDFILTHYIPNGKYFIIPYSDGAAYELDNRLNEFKKFLLPSISGKQSKLAKMMEKQNQYDFAIENNIKIAKTVVINFKQDYLLDIKKIKFPVILKPIISAEGDKKDITICHSLEEFEEAINILKNKNYNRILVQEFLNIDYEIDVFGCIMKNSKHICLIPTKTIRSWPVNGGTNSFSQIITDKDIVNKCKKIINILKKSGFYGLYDIELFVIDKEVYLNEINYRNSGDVYMGINQQYYYPIAYIYDYLEIQYNIEEYPRIPSFAMTECADIRNVLNKNLSLKDWKKDYNISSDYALKFKGDMRPAFSRYFYYIIQFLKRKKY